MPRTNALAAKAAKEKLARIKKSLQSEGFTIRSFVDAVSDCCSDNCGDGCKGGCQDSCSSGTK